MVDERRGSPEWARIQAKLWCSPPSAELVRVQRVQNPKLWAAFVGPVAEFRDAGGYVRVDHDSSAVREVWMLLIRIIMLPYIAEVHTFFYCVDVHACRWFAFERSAISTLSSDLVPT